VGGPKREKVGEEKPARKRKRNFTPQDFPRRIERINPVKNLGGLTVCFERVEKPPSPGKRNRGTQGTTGQGGKRKKPPGKTQPPQSQITTRGNFFFPKERKV